MGSNAHLVAPVHLCRDFLRGSSVRFPSSSWVTPGDMGRVKGHRLPHSPQQKLAQVYPCVLCPLSRAPLDPAPSAAPIH